MSQREYLALLAARGLRRRRKDSGVNLAASLEKNGFDVGVERNNRQGPTFVLTAYRA
jgi:hypothetical protein